MLMIYSSDISANVSTTAGNVILFGSESTVSQLQFNNGTIVSHTASTNANVKGLILKTATTQNNNSVMSLYTVYGSGRLYFV
jgi:hypothetical protein